MNYLKMILMKLYQGNLVLQILIGIIAGTILATLSPPPPCLFPC